MDRCDLAPWHPVSAGMADARGSNE